MIEKILSGGQTGVDRAALDVALELAISCGGWCPAGRHADDGPIPARYPLQETADMDHTVRTENNVRDSDGTLMFYRGKLQGGSAYAVLMAQKLARPVLAIDVDAPPAPAEVVAWLARHGVRRVHIGGQREVTSPGIYAQAGGLIRNILRLALRQDA
jgi:hypothetical protein